MFGLPVRAREALLADADACISLGVVAARQGDVEEAVRHGQRTLAGERTPAASLMLVARDLSRVLKDRDATKPATSQYLEEPTGCSPNSATERYHRRVQWPFTKRVEPTHAWGALSLAIAAAAIIVTALAALNASNPHFRWWWPTNWMAIPAAILVLGLFLLAVPIQRSQPAAVASGQELDHQLLPATDQIVFGEIPQRPLSFQERLDLQKQLIQTSSRHNIVYAVTGIRGVGKSQLAAAIARKRIADRWRLVAWINAEDPTLLVDELGKLAIELGISNASSGAELSAQRLRHWLESGGTRCLLIFDNAIDADVIRPLLPVSGKAQVIVTSPRRSLASVGTPVHIEVFSHAQAIAYLEARTGIADGANARAVAADLGYLPLALSQAAAVIAGQNLDYATYRQRLANTRITDYLTHTQEDPYPLGAAEAILLSIAAIDIADYSGRSRQMLQLMSVLAPSGVTRQVLYAAAYQAGSYPQIGAASDVDAALQRLADSSLVTWSIDGSAYAHRLVARVVRELASHDDSLSRAVCRVIDTLSLRLTSYKNDDRQILSDVKAVEVVAHIVAMTDYLSQLDVALDDNHTRLLRGLISYSMGYNDGYETGLRYYTAMKLAEQGLLDEAIGELKALIAEMTRPEARIPEEYVTEVAVALNGLLERRAGGGRNS